MNFYPTTVAELISNIITANGNGVADTIFLAPKHAYILDQIHNVDAVDGNNGLPIIRSAITIVGNGSTIIRPSSLNDKFRIVHVASNGALNLDGLTIRGGELNGLNNGGAGILNRGSVTLTNCTVFDNKSTNGGYGGGLIAFGGTTLSITNSTISENFASSGGGIFSQGTLTINNSILSRNRGFAGGGLWVSGGTGNITYSILSENNSADGGALRCNASGTLTVTYSDLLRNIAGNGAACVYVYDNGSAIVTLNYNRIVGNISGNPANADVAKDLSPSLIATNNWWGDPIGPRHPVTNPTSTGDSVSDHVNYTSPLTSEIAEHAGMSACGLGLGWGATDATNSNNPISLRLGEKRLDVTSLSLPSAAESLAFTRSYRQGQLNSVPNMGIGWIHNHLYKLTLTGTSPTRVAEISLPTGGTIRLAESSPIGHFDAKTGSASVMDYNASTSEYTLTGQDSSKYIFDATTLNLKFRIWSSGEVWTYFYSSGKLTDIVDNYGRKLQFAYINAPSQYNDGQLWRVGDHTAANLVGSIPTGRYVEFTYATEKINGSLVTNPRPLLIMVRDVLNYIWEYDYYGQTNGESDPSQLNWMTERQSPSVDSTGDGIPDGVITLEKLSYLFNSQVDIAINGDMELDRDWFSIFQLEPATNERSTTYVNTGLYSRHVVTSAINRGIESALWDLLAGRTYTVTARIYVISGSVKMQVTGTSVFNQTSSGVGAWQTLTATYTATTPSLNHQLQFVAASLSGGIAEYYVDSVSILETILNFSGIVQERGIQGATAPLEHKTFWFQVNGSKTFEVHVGKKTTHYFDRGIYSGSADALLNRSLEPVNAQFRPSSQADPNGNAVWLNWSTDGKYLNNITDPLGNETAFNYNSDNTLRQQIDAQNRKTFYIYDAPLRQPTLILLAPNATDLIINGGMELDANWTNVGGVPPTNERFNTQVDIGDHSRYIVAGANTGIEGNSWDLIANQTYIITARIYVVSGPGAVKMQVSGTTFFDKTTATIGKWETLTATYTPVSTLNTRKLQFIASGGTAQFYVDAVTIFMTTELAINGGMEMDDSTWTPVVSPTTNQRSMTKVDTGNYSRRVVADTANEGIEGNSWSLFANQNYTIRARVYPVSGSVKMQVSGIPEFDVTTQETGNWQTLSAEFVASSNLAGKKLQFLSIGGSAEFYVDTVSISASRELAINGDMELDSVWTPVGSPTTNVRQPRSDTGNYSRHIVVNALNQGIESASWTLTLDHTYIVMARVYTVRGTIKMQVPGVSAFDKTSSLTGAWETLRVIYKATSTLASRRLQFVATALVSGSAEYYVDSVHIVDLGVISGNVENIVQWQEFAYDTRARSTSELIINPKDASILQRSTRSYLTSGGGKGLLGRVEQFDAQQPSISNYTDYIYDIIGRVIKTKRGSTLGDCCATLTDYDLAGKVLAITNVNATNVPNDPIVNPVTTYGYDSVGRQIRVTINSRTINAKTTLNFFDALDRPVRTITNYVNQSSGSSESPALWVWNNGWKKSDGTTPINHGSDNSQNVISETSYNARGLVRLQRDPLGNVTLFGYDDAGRLIKAISSASQPAYNNDYAGLSPDPTLKDYVAGSATDIDLITINHNDAAGNLLKTVAPSGTVSFIVYDALNRPVKTVRAAKDTATIDVNLGDATYNPANDPRSSEYTPLSTADRDLIEVTDYDSLGRVVRRQDTLGNWTLLGYNTLGQQIKVIQSASNPTYDMVGDPTLASYPSNTVADQDIVNSTEYDRLGQPVKMTDSLGVVTFTVYDGFGRVVKTVRAAKDGATVALNVGDAGYNSANDPRSGSYSISSNPDRDLIEVIEYDANGRVVRQKQLLDNRPSEQWDTTLFGYDNLGRQIKVIRHASNHNYNIVTDPDLSDYPASSNTDQDIISRTAYDEQQHVMYSEDSLGAKTWFAYDSLGRQFKMIVNAVGIATDGSSNDPRSASYIPSVDPDKDLITLRSYDLIGRTVVTQDVLNRLSRNVYDAVGRTIRTIANYVDQGEDARLWVWNNGWKKSDGTTPISHGTDNDQNIITDALYDRAGHLVQTLDHRNNQTQFIYDKIDRRIKSITNYISQVPSNPSDWVWSTTNDRWERGIADTTAIDFGVSKDQNRISTTIYDKGGRQLASRDAAGIETRRIYDAIGRLTQTIINYIDGVFSTVTPDADLINTSMFNKGGQVISTTDTRGTQTSFTYDKNGRQLTNTQAAGSALTSVNYTSYDKAGRILRGIQNWIDNGVSPDTKTGSVWSFLPTNNGEYNDRNLIVVYEYDLASRPIKVTDPTGNFITTSYFKDGKVQALTNQENIITQYRYDGIRRRTRVVQGYVVQGSSDPANWIWVQGAAQWQYPPNTPIVHGTNNDENIIVLSTYDKAGRVLNIRDPRGNLTNYNYDLRDRRKILTNPLSISWQTAYADLLSTGGTRITATFPGITGGTAYQVLRDFDRLGRPANIVYGDPATTRDVKFLYDNAGNRSKMSEYGNTGFTSLVRETSYSYDDVHRVTNVAFDNDGNGIPDESVSYQYDAGGRRTKLVMPGGLTVTYLYDMKGQLVSLVDWDNQGSSFEYDLAGRHIATCRSNGLLSSYCHDANGRLRLLKHTARDKTLAHFAYEVDKRGNRTQALEAVRRVGGATTSVLYNNKGVVARGSWTDVSGTEEGLTAFKKTIDTGASLKFRFLGSQNVTLKMGQGPDHSIYDVYVAGTLWQSYDGYTGSFGERTITIPLDAEGPHEFEVRNRRDRNILSNGYKLRLKSLTVDGTYDLHTIEYTYDKLSRLREARFNPGSNLSASDSDLLRRYQYAFDRSTNRTQQIVTVAGASTTTNYTYNTANQLTTSGVSYDNNGNMMNDGINAFSWDRANRLRSMGAQTYKYDGVGNRVERNTLKYLLDVQPGLAVVLSDSDGVNTNRYVHAPRGILEQKDTAGNWEHILQDGIGSVRTVVDNNAAALESRLYEPYGKLNLTDVTGTEQTSYHFTGEMLDANDLLFLRARYYGSTHGTFTALDPLETANRYNYVSGNPVNYVDPSGLFNRSSCTVEYGDYLERIALETGVFVSGQPVTSRSSAEDIRTAWRSIWQVNRSIIGSDPGRIVPGQNLTLPRNRDGVCMGSTGLVVNQPRSARPPQPCSLIGDPTPIPPQYPTPTPTIPDVTQESVDSCEPTLPAYLEHPWLNRECQLNRMAVAPTYNPRCLMRSRRIQSVGVLLAGSGGSSVNSLIALTGGAGIMFAFKGNLYNLDLSQCVPYVYGQAGPLAFTGGIGSYLGVTWSTASYDQWGGFSANLSGDLSLGGGITFGVSANLGGCDYNAYAGPTVAGGLPSVFASIGYTIDTRIYGHTCESIINSLRLIDPTRDFYREFLSAIYDISEAGRQLLN